jgi:hypothetical protein
MLSLFTPMLAMSFLLWDPGDPGGVLPVASEMKVNCFMGGARGDLVSAVLYLLLSRMRTGFLGCL